MARPTLREQLDATPIPAAVDKYWEAWYFLLGVCDNYHDPIAFRYELNAFIQALRNITFMLQSEPSRPRAFAQWYQHEQEVLRSDSSLRRFVEARNLIVKQTSLATASKAELGLFRGRRFKLGINLELSPFHDTEYLVRKAQEFMIGLFIDEMHSDVGEQIGLRRTWVAPDIGSTEVSGLCADALRKMGELLERAHVLWDSKFDATFDLPNMEAVFVRLETDLDPTLLQKWGWERVRGGTDSSAG